MPLLFLITYIVICYFLYRKNSWDSKLIPVLLQVNWIIAFALLFVFLIYFSEINLSVTEQNWFIYSFYGLILWYFVTYCVFLMKYRKKLKESKYKSIDLNNVWTLETIINKSYFLVLVWLSITYFIYTKPLDLFGWDWFQVLLYIWIMFSWLFALFKNKLISY